MPPKVQPEVFPVVNESDETRPDWILLTEPVVALAVPIVGTSIPIMTTSIITPDNASVILSDFIKTQSP